MKIVVDARLYGLENTGIGRYITNLVDGLQKHDKENKYTLLLNQSYYKTLKTTENFEKKLVNLKHYSLREQLLLPGILYKLSPNLVHFPHFNVPIFYRGRYVVTIHDLLMNKHKGKDSTTHNPIAYQYKRLGYRKVIDHAVKNAEVVFVPTEFVKSDIQNDYKLNNEKILVTHEGVDQIFYSPQKFAPIIRKYGINNPYFIYTGNLYPHKNIDRAMEAIELINENRDRQIQLVIVSARNYFTQKLKEKIKDKNFAKYVKVTGFVPDEDLAALYQDSVGFLYPSLHEGFGLPGLEAIASGTLAIVSDIPVFKEVYGKAAIYFNPYDFTSIAKTMDDVLKMNAGKRKKYLILGKKQLEKYDWNKMVKQTMSVYNSLK